MDLGNFSVSLAVKDLAASRAFYEKLGFEPIGGEAEQNWLILQNETATIGLFSDSRSARRPSSAGPGGVVDSSNTSACIGLAGTHLEARRVAAAAPNAADLRVFASPRSTGGAFPPC